MNFFLVGILCFINLYSKENRSCVAHMKDGDFYGSEQSHVMEVTILVIASIENNEVLKSLHRPRTQSQSA